MLKIVCECGTVVEAFPYNEVVKHMTYITNTYHTKESHLCKKCFINSHRQKDKLNKFLK